MKYYSTRDAAAPPWTAAEAIKMGLSRDGGLLTPCEIPQIDRSLSGEPGERPVPGAGRQR